MSRTADESAAKYHGKYLIVDDTLYVFGFNFTKLDIEHSRSFGVVTATGALVSDAMSLFEADRRASRTTAGHDRRSWSAPRRRATC